MTQYQQPESGRPRFSDTDPRIAVLQDIWFSIHHGQQQLLKLHNFDSRLNQRHGEKAFGVFPYEYLRKRRTSMFCRSRESGNDGLIGDSLKIFKE